MTDITKVLSKKIIEINNKVLNIIIKEIKKKYYNKRIKPAIQLTRKRWVKNFQY